MKDFLGNELQVGDKVVVVTTHRESNELQKATVVGWTAEYVNVAVHYPDGFTTRALRRAPHKVIKVDWR